MATYGMYSRETHGDRLTVTRSRRRACGLNGMYTLVDGQGCQLYSGRPEETPLVRTPSSDVLTPQQVRQDAVESSDWTSPLCTNFPQPGRCIASSVTVFLEFDPRSSNRHPTQHPVQTGRHDSLASQTPVPRDVLSVSACLP